ncbi:MAG: glucosaminidase domain-containing protein [Saprospiraceae bacterium]
MKLITAFVLISLSSIFTTDIQKLADVYINNYKDIAVQEMYRTKIPASIKLAQGLLESDWGRSDLANVANNHFGIKCGKYWEGGTFYKEDDDKNDKGELIESCFRSFATPLDSYMAHSSFLMDPKKEYRYGFLFEYSSTDYESWAFGLKKSGYATDPTYPQKIISIVKKYNLSQYDVSFTNDVTTLNKPTATQKHKEQIATNTNTSPSSSSSTVTKLNSTVTTANDKSHNSAKLVNKPTIKKHVSRLTYSITAINKCRMVKAKGGESIMEIAHNVGVPLEEVLSFNEAYLNADQLLNTDDIVYIEKKKRSYRGDTDFHIVSEGETMQSIAQKYGIRLKSLYAKNRMPKNSETFPNVHLSLKRTVSLNKRPRFKLPNSKRKHNFLFEDQQVIQKKRT